MTRHETPTQQILGMTNSNSPRASSLKLESSSVTSSTGGASGRGGMQAAGDAARPRPREALVVSPLTSPRLLHSTAPPIAQVSSAPSQSAFGSPRSMHSTAPPIAQVGSAPSQSAFGSPRSTPGLPWRSSSPYGTCSPPHPTPT